MFFAPGNLKGVYKSKPLLGLANYIAFDQRNKSHYTGQAAIIVTRVILLQPF